MSYIEIDDDDDDIVESQIKEKPQTKEDKIKAVIKQGMDDIQDIVVLLEKIEKLIEPFGDLETILELKTLYSEVIPDVLLGNYSTLLEGLNESDKEVVLIITKQRRKTIFDKLVEKYS